MNRTNSPLPIHGLLTAGIGVPCLKNIFLYSSFLFNVIKNGFDLFQPLIESLENNFDEIEKADAEIGLKFFYPTLKINFDPIIISEERLPEANKLYIEFREKLLKLRDEGEKNKEQKSMVVLHTLIPLKDILTLDFLPEETS